MIGGQAFVNEIIARGPVAIALFQAGYTVDVTDDFANIEARINEIINGDVPPATILANLDLMLELDTAIAAASPDEQVFFQTAFSVNLTDGITETEYENFLAIVTGEETYTWGTYRYTDLGAAGFVDTLQKNYSLYTRIAALGAPATTNFLAIYGVDVTVDITLPGYNILSGITNTPNDPATRCRSTPSSLRSRSAARQPEEAQPLSA